MFYPEVLSPAGDMEKLIAAVKFGADAVYLAGELFGMRSASKNFTDEELKKAVAYCHDNNVLVYLTCNVLLNNNEIPLIEQSMKYWHEIGIDALIIGDMGIFMLARRTIPSMELHISTQAGITNYLTANEFYMLGAKRIVLARELSLKEIQKIRENTPSDLVIEAFVHGAMCMAFSGRCLISQYLTGRNANHGECAQSCRWNYTLTEQKRNGEYMPVVETEEGTYFFNAKDLCMIEYLDKLVQAGISSFKIEGRAKSAFYSAAVTNMYRCAVDIYKSNPDSYMLPNWLKEEPYKVSHRAYSTGFYFPENPPSQVYENAGYIREWEVTAIAENFSNGKITVTQRNKFSVGDILEIVQPGEPPFEITVSKIINSSGESVASAPHPMETLSIPCELEVIPGSLLRKKV